MSWANTAILGAPGWTLLLEDWALGVAAQVMCGGQADPCLSPWPLCPWQGEADRWPQNGSSCPLASRASPVQLLFSGRTLHSFGEI